MFLASEMNISSFSFKEINECNFIFTFNNYLVRHLYESFIYFTFLNDVMINILTCKRICCFPIVSLGEILGDWIMNLYEGICYRDLALSNCWSWLSSLYKAVVCMADAGAWSLRAGNQEGKVDIKKVRRASMSWNPQPLGYVYILSLFLSLNPNWHTEKDQRKQKCKKYDENDS